MERKNEIEEAIKYVGDTVFDVIGSEFDKQSEDYDFDWMSDYAPYGSTFVESDRYILDESEEQFRTCFEEEMTVDSVIEMLKNDNSFRESIKEMVKYVAWNRSVSV